MTSMPILWKRKGIEMTKPEQRMGMELVTTSSKKRFTLRDDSAGLSQWLVERASFYQ